MVSRFVQRIMNAKPSNVTGVPPAKLMFNQFLDIERHLFPSAVRAAAQPVQSDISDYVTSLEKAADELYQQAYEAQQKVLGQREAKRARGEATSFEVGSLVLVKAMDARSKLDPIREGPFRVVEALPSVGGQSTLEYVVEDIQTRVRKQVGIFRLTQYVGADQYVDPIDVARQDNKEWEIEAILDHKPRVALKDFVTKSRKLWYFKIKWKGSDEETWNYNGALL